MENIEKSIQDNFNQQKEWIEKNFMGSDIEKAKRAEIGETRVWSGVKMQKQANGEWKEIKEGGGKGEPIGIKTDEFYMKMGDEELKVNLTQLKKMRDEYNGTQKQVGMFQKYDRKAKFVESLLKEREGKGGAIKKPGSGKQGGTITPHEEPKEDKLNLSKLTISDLSKLSGVPENNIKIYSKSPHFYIVLLGGEGNKDNTIRKIREIKIKGLIRNIVQPNFQGGLTWNIAYS